MQLKIAKKNNQTREEAVFAFKVYCKVLFKNKSKTNTITVKYANIIGRYPSALNMKVVNFGRLDPELKKKGIVGLENGSKLDEIIWNEFNGNWEKLAFESELLISKFQNKAIEESFNFELENLPKGKERETLIITRINQTFSGAQFFSHIIKNVVLLDYQFLIFWLRVKSFH